MAASKQLQNLESRLNKDEALRNEFLKNPAKVLKREGFDLDAETTKAVNDQFKDLQLPKLPKLKIPKIKIGISIKIRF
jgi:hypothetical protein